MAESLVTIGDFSRMTYLTVKALRYYQDVGILTPWSVDQSSGYRSYHLSQVPIAQVIRRLRDLDMPVDDVRAVVEAPDVDSRNKAISEHLQRMETQLGETRATVASLRSLLQPPKKRDVEFRAELSSWVLAIRETVPMDEAHAWGATAYGELYAALESVGARRAGVDGALFHAEFFEDHEGALVAFIPVAQRVEIPDDLGRVTCVEQPGVEFAVMTHRGSAASIDRTYADLGTFVTTEAIGVDGPIRENFLVTPADSDDPDDHLTEVCWPIFRTQTLGAM